MDDDKDMIDTRHDAKTTDIGHDANTTDTKHDKNLYTSAPALNAAEKREKIKTLFNDLHIFKDKNITIHFYGGATVCGKLLGFDEIANCILEQENNRKVIVLGRSILKIFEDNVVSL